MSDFTMAILMVYKRNSQFIDLSELVENLSSLGLIDTLQEYYDKPFKKEAIVYAVMQIGSTR